MSRKLILLMTVLSFTTACGVKGPPLPPEDDDLPVVSTSPSPSPSPARKL